MAAPGACRCANDFMSCDCSYGMPETETSRMPSAGSRVGIETLRNQRVAVGEMTCVRAASRAAFSASEHRTLTLVPSTQQMPQYGSSSS